MVKIRKMVTIVEEILSEAMAVLSRLQGEAHETG